MKTIRYITVLLAGWLAVDCFQSPLQGQVLYSDNFDTDTSGSWSVFGGSLSTTNDYTAEFALDYSALGIPSAPNSTGGTTRGLKIQANHNDENGEIAGVSAYPIGQTFSGDYALRFDMWINYNGPAFGGPGSTEHAIFGLNHAGDKVSFPNVAPSDGVWFAVAGEGGTIRDYRAYVGDGEIAAPVELLDVDGGFLDRNMDGTLEFNSTDELENPLRIIFPVPPFETPGAPGKQWVQVEVRQRSGTVTWLMNGYVIAEHANLNGFTSGTIMLGYADLIAGLPTPRTQSYAIIDNVRVVDLTGMSELPVLTVIATDNAAAEPGSDTGTYTITRTGSTAVAMTVRYRMDGTGSNGVDYVGLNGMTTIPMGSASTTITLTPFNDTIGEPGETAILGLVGSADYELREEIGATVTIADDGDVSRASLTAVRPLSYEYSSNTFASFRIDLSNPSSSALTVNYTIGGTAVNGTDYLSIPTSVVIPAGGTNAVINIVAINDALIETNRTVSLTLGSGTGYVLQAPTNGQVTVRSDDIISGPVLFSDDFNTDTTGSWQVNKAHPNNTAVFNYDYSSIGVPSAPGSTDGSTRGLRLDANTLDGAATFTGLSASPLGRNFTGDYRLRFDMWVNYNGPLNGGGAGSTYIQGGGVGTTGVAPQWAGGTPDSVWFAVTGDGGSAFDYRAYSAAAAGVYLPASGVYAAGTQSTARNSSESYYNEFGRGTAPAAQVSIEPIQAGVVLVGAAGMAWRNVVVTKQGTNITFDLDGLRIATVNTTGLTLSSNVALIYSDTASGYSGNPPMSFGLVDNVRVEALAAAPAHINWIRVTNTTVEIDFNGASSSVAGDYVLESSATVDGTYAAVNPPATIQQVGLPGHFLATTLTNGSTRFYRIRN